jgi:hypothetical protein
MYFSVGIDGPPGLRVLGRVARLGSAREVETKSFYYLSQIL